MFKKLINGDIFQFRTNTISSKNAYFLTPEFNKVIALLLATNSNKSLSFIVASQAEEYGARTAVLEPYFAVIQAGDLQPYFNRNTDRKRLIYSVNTVKIRPEYGCKSPVWITEKYDTHTAVYG